ncbi:ATP-grasp fold amidoligase family protein [Tsuneonella amylolytica]|uniref:ATP-grasp fold amidoligase family protein n=1 Tax=Tsuneonella amylolytica TaxID=2338327 RepID=UPI000EA8BD6D|nr:ATP-grasp fold amidoligase family protein [Tsuneonella amylolytica]
MQNQTDLDPADNYAAVAAMFVEKFGRDPLPPENRDALINDLIFMRMIRPDWSALQRSLVDKSTAKVAAASLYPDLRVPETLAVISMDGVSSPAALAERLAPFIGRDAVAKPAQASGGTVFLKHPVRDEELHQLFDLASRDYALVMREMQYFGMPKRVVVERLVPTPGDGTPDDFKFHCIYGEPILCQIDHARFGERWSRVMRLPGFSPLHDGDGLVPPASVIWPERSRMEEMAAIAAALSRPFDYVRVDLYNGVDGIYFGEMTFTPSASLGIAPSAAGCHRMTDTHRAYSGALMDAYHRKVAPPV